MRPSQANDRTRVPRVPTSCSEPPGSSGALVQGRKEPSLGTREKGTLLSTRHCAVLRALPAGARRVLVVLAVIMMGALAAPPAHASRLLVNSALGNSILSFDGQTGASPVLFAPPGTGGLSYPEGLAIGPDDGNIYVRSAGSVLRFNGTTGAFIDVFASGGAQSPDSLSFQLRWDATTGSFVATSAAGGLDGPTGLSFGPDGNLYVSSYGSVLLYRGQTGAAPAMFAAGGGLVNATGLAFGPDGNLYVSNYPGNTILAYGRATGAFIGAFVSADPNLDRPTGLTFGPDGNLYLCSYDTNSVLRYNGSTGASMGAFTTGGGLSGPTGLTFGLDGNLYVSSYLSNSIARYDGKTG